MIDNTLRDELADIAPEAIILDDPAYDNAIIGITYEGGLIYDYDLMVMELVKDDGMDEDEAAEFIDYNTVRAIPYMPDPKPVIQQIGINTPVLYK